MTKTNHMGHNVSNTNPSSSYKEVFFPKSYEESSIDSFVAHGRINASQFLTCVGRKMVEVTLTST